MLQAIINSDKFDHYFNLAQATLKHYVIAADAVLHKVYLSQSFKKGDRYGPLKMRTRNTDQTYDQFIKQEINREWSLFAMYYNDGVFHCQVQRLKELINELDTAIKTNLTTLLIDVADINLISSAPKHYLLV